MDMAPLKRLAQTMPWWDLEPFPHVQGPEGCGRFVAAARGQDVIVVYAPKRVGLALFEIDPYGYAGRWYHPEEERDAPVEWTATEGGAAV